VTSDRRRAVQENALLHHLRHRRHGDPDERMGPRRGTVISGSKVGLKTKLDTLDGVSNANFGYSSCAILRATQGTAFTTLMQSRGWSQLY
jgi:hypothetical protein